MIITARTRTCQAEKALGENKHWKSRAGVRDESQGSGKVKSGPPGVTTSTWRSSWVNREKWVQGSCPRDQNGKNKTQEQKETKTSSNGKP